MDDATKEHAREFANRAIAAWVAVGVTTPLLVWLAGPPGAILALLATLAAIWYTSMALFERVEAVVNEHAD